jgi:hypothetical protein
MKFRIVFWDISLMMKAVRTSETSVDNYFTRQYIPEDNSEQDTLTLWTRLLIEKPTIAQLVKKFVTFQETESSLPCSQEPVTGCHHETNQSVRNADTLLLYDLFQH